MSSNFPTLSWSISAPICPRWSKGFDLRSTIFVCASSNLAVGTFFGFPRRKLQSGMEVFGATKIS